MPDILDGVVEPGRVFDRTIDIEEIPDGYRSMADREALKVLIRPMRVGMRRRPCSSRGEHGHVDAPSIGGFATQ
jgi:hypothetical protein